MTHTPGGRARRGRGRSGQCRGRARGGTLALIRRLVDLLALRLGVPFTLGPGTFAASSPRRRRASRRRSRYASCSGVGLVIGRPAGTRVEKRPSNTARASGRRDSLGTLMVPSRSANDEEDEAPRPTGRGASLCTVLSFRAA